MEHVLLHAGGLLVVVGVDVGGLGELDLLAGGGGGG